MPKFEQNLSKPEHTSLEVSRKQLFQWGTSCLPADFSKAELAINEMYTAVGQPTPTFIRLSSPHECLKAIDSLSKKRGALVRVIRDRFRDQALSNIQEPIINHVGEFLWNEIKETFFNKLKFQLQEQLGLKLRTSLMLNFEDTARRGFWGQQAIYCSGAYLSMLTLGVIYNSELYDILKLWEAIATSIGWWWPYENMCFISDRHEACCLEYDSNRGLHCESGPALRFRDGYELYALNGEIREEEK